MDEGTKLTKKPKVEEEETGEQQSVYKSGAHLILDLVPTFSTKICRHHRVWAHLLLPPSQSPAGGGALYRGSEEFPYAVKSPASRLRCFPGKHQFFQRRQQNGPLAFGGSGNEILAPGADAVPAPVRAGQPEHYKATLLTHHCKEEAP